jgi:hypothetical protein
MISLDLHGVADLSVRAGASCWIELTATCQNGTSQEITFFVASGDELERKQLQLDILTSLRDKLNELLEEY